MENLFQALIQPGTWARSFAAASDRTVIWSFGPNSLLQNIHMVVSTLLLSPLLEWSVHLSCFSGWAQRDKKVHSGLHISHCLKEAHLSWMSVTSRMPALDGMADRKHWALEKREEKKSWCSGRAILKFHIKFSCFVEKNMGQLRRISNKVQVFYKLCYSLLKSIFSLLTL